MPQNTTKKFFVDARKKIMKNAENLLEEALILYEKNRYQRSAFNAMSCIEECGKLWMIRLVSTNSVKTKNLPSPDKLLRNHTEKTRQLAMGFYINSAADRRHGSHPVNKMVRTSGIILLVRSRKWMDWRNSCLYTDISVSQKQCRRPSKSIKHRGFLSSDNVYCA